MALYLTCIFFQLSLALTEYNDYEYIHLYLIFGAFCDILLTSTLVRGSAHMQEEVMDAKQVAELLKVGYRTVVRMADRGELPAFKVGDLWRFRKADIDAYIQRQVDARQQGKDDSDGV
jgi:excisionase family DNA binding protein